MRTTRTAITAVPTTLVVMLFAGHTAMGAFDSNDMAGAWAYSALRVDGPDDQGAEGGITVSFDAAGNVTAGSPDEAGITTGTYEITEDGEVTVNINLKDGGILRLASGTMDGSKSIIAGAGGGLNWESHQVWIKKGATHSMVDMAGMWAYSALRVNDPDNQVAESGITVSFDAAGNVTGGSPAEAKITGGTYAITPDGEVTIIVNRQDGDSLNLGSGTMDRSKRIIAGVGGVGSPTEGWESHQIWIKMGATYSGQDMAGTWVYSALRVDGPNDLGVESGITVSFDASGNVTGGSLEEAGSVTGTYLIEPDGEVTISVDRENDRSLSLAPGTMDSTKGILAGAGGGSDWESHQVWIKKWASDTNNENTYTVGGTVYTDPDNPLTSGLPGVQIFMSGDHGAFTTATAGDQGFWQIPDVPEGTYTVMPSQAGYSFERMADGMVVAAPPIWIGVHEANGPVNENIQFLATPTPAWVPYDWNGDGFVSIIGDVPPFVNCVYFQQYPDWPQERLLPVGDCNNDGFISIVGDVPCFVNCVYFENCP